MDPLAPEHVAPLVVYLASPAAETINGEVFVVHGGVAAVMEPPRVRTAFHAASPDGMWTLESVHAALSPAFGDTAPSVGFIAKTPSRWPPRPSDSRRATPPRKAARAARQGLWIEILRAFWS